MFNNKIVHGVSMNNPLVSIGLPVYNGENYLAQTLESLVTQTYQTIEIIISDNGSTDRTAEICQQFVVRDARIRYYRSDVNRGAAWNYNQTFALAKGKYFKWAAHDDFCASTWVEKCVSVLEQRPEVVLTFTQVIDIEADGKEIAAKSSTVQASAQRPHQRFRGISRVRPTHTCEEVFGLVRIEVLKQTKLIDNYSDSDRTLLADLVLHGPFYEVPEPLFYHRIHINNSVMNKHRYERTAWFDTSAAGKIVFPNWRQLFELMLVIQRSKVSLDERVCCYGHLLGWAKRRRQRLLRDLVWASGQLAGRWLGRNSTVAVSTQTQQ
jgi:glycosyltransferase involved in cell wall biosynthesis